MKLQLLLLLLLFSLSKLFSQKQAIVVSKNDSKRSIFINENKQIKIKTNSGKIYLGKFSIIDEKTISIDSISIPINSIVTIQKKSIASMILTPLIVATGVIFVLGGVGVAVLGGTKSLIGVGMLFSGLYLGSIPFIASKHQSDNWKYKITETQKLQSENPPNITE
jgi:hypothetical protein